MRVAQASDSAPNRVAKAPSPPISSRRQAQVVLLVKRLLLGTLLAAAFGSEAVACPSNLVAVTKEGHFGARTLGGYRDLVRLQTQRRITELLDRVEQGSLVRLPAAKTVCIRNSWRHSYRTLIVIPELDEAVWVHLHALDW